MNCMKTLGAGGVKGGVQALLNLKFPSNDIRVNPAWSIVYEAQ